MSWLWSTCLKLLGKKWLWLLAACVILALYIVGVIDDQQRAQVGFMFFSGGFVILWVYQWGREAERKPKVKLRKQMDWGDFLTKVQAYGFTHLKELKIGPDEGYRIMAHRRKKLVLVAEAHKEYGRLMLGDLRVYGTARAKNISFKTVKRLFDVNGDTVRIYNWGVPSMNYLEFCCKTPEKLFSALYGISLSMQFVPWTDPNRMVWLGDESEDWNINQTNWVSILAKGPTWLRNFVSGNYTEP